MPSDWLKILFLQELKESIEKISSSNIKVSGVNI
jgi:hypothetical protein